MKIVISILQNILRLRKVIEENKISTLDKKLPLTREVLSYPYKNPVIYSNYIINELNLSKPTTHAIIKDFVNLKILKEVTGQKRNRLFVFEEYVTLFR